ncbi:hypothetical protein D9M73_281370 [compost metagenome]
MDLPRQQLLAGAGLALDQHRQGAWGQLVDFLAQAARAGIDEDQRTGANAQGAAVGVGEGQQRLTGVFLAHGEISRRAQAAEQRALAFC